MAAAPEPHVRPDRRDLLLGSLARLAFALAGLFLFIVALELLKRGAGGYGRELIRVLNISTPASALGFGWLLAYVFLSGSPVAAVAVSFFASGTIDRVQTFMMITGSRLGASFVVLFVGFLYALRGHRRTTSLAIGVLALLTTAAIYVPALILGSWLLSVNAFAWLQIEAGGPLASVVDALTDPLVSLASDWLPAWALLPTGAAVLLLGFQLLDKALPDLSPAHPAFQRIDHLTGRPLAMFLLGAAVTSVTMSVSVSLSILVPLAARGVVRREQTLPYIMGANITTFVDTLVAALIVGGPAAFTIVVVEMCSVAALSIAVLIFAYGPFQRRITALQERIVRDSRTLAIFLGVILLVPLLLLVLG